MTIILNDERIEKAAKDKGVVEQAAIKEKLVEKARLAIMEAGNGLVAAIEQCEGGKKPTLQTAYVLVVTQAYIQDALAAILEHEGSGIISSS